MPSRTRSSVLSVRGSVRCASGVRSGRRRTDHGRARASLTSDVTAARRGGREATDDGRQVYSRTSGGGRSCSRLTDRDVIEPGGGDRVAAVTLTAGAGQRSAERRPARGAAADRADTSAAGGARRRALRARDRAARKADRARDEGQGAAGRVDRAGRRSADRVEQGLRLRRSREEAARHRRHRLSRRLRLEAVHRHRRDAARRARARSIWTRPSPRICRRSSRRIRSARRSRCGT